MNNTTNSPYRLKEPGKRRRYKTDVHLKDFYIFYKTVSKSPTDYETFKKVIFEFNESICKECIYHNLAFKMPSRLGILNIRKIKVKAFINKDGSLNTKYLAVNWKATKKLWEEDPEAKEKHQRVFHLNRHSKGYICRWHWDKFNLRLLNRTYYHLDIMRKYDRELAKAMTDPDINVDYYDKHLRHGTNKPREKR